MTDEEVEQVSRTLGVVLPREYRAVLLRPPADLHDALGLDIAVDGEWITRQNLEMRDSPAFFFGREAPWPTEFIIIGEDGNGNAYFIRANELISPAVYFLDHEQPDRDDLVSATSISGWLEVVRSNVQKQRRNEEGLRQAINRKKWWKFWA